MWSHLCYLSSLPIHYSDFLGLCVKLPLQIFNMINIAFHIFKVFIFCKSSTEKSHQQLKSNYINTNLLIVGLNLLTGLLTVVSPQ